MSSDDIKKLELEPPADKKSYAGIPEADFVVKPSIFRFANFITYKRCISRVCA